MVALSQLRPSVRGRGTSLPHRLYQRSRGQQPWWTTPSGESAPSSTRTRVATYVRLGTYGRTPAVGWFIPMHGFIHGARMNDTEILDAPAAWGNLLRQCSVKKDSLLPDTQSSLTKVRAFHGDSLASLARGWAPCLAVLPTHGLLRTQPWPSRQSRSCVLSGVTGQTFGATSASARARSHRCFPARSFTRPVCEAQFC